MLSSIIFTHFFTHFYYKTPNLTPAF
jgi:hypothetical protein